MHPHLLTVDAIVFLLLFGIWSKEGYFNMGLKTVFLVLGIINLAVVFGVKL